MCVCTEYTFTHQAKNQTVCFFWNFLIILVLEQKVKKKSMKKFNTILFSSTTYTFIRKKKRKKRKQRSCIQCVTNIFIFFLLDLGTKYTQTFNKNSVYFIGLGSGSDPIEKNVYLLHNMSWKKSFISTISTS